MGYTINGTTGEPVYNNTSSTQADIQAAADYAASLTSQTVSTFANLSTVPYTQVGMIRFVTAENSGYIYTGVTYGWVPIVGGIAAYNIKTSAMSGISSGTPNQITTWDVQNITGGITYTVGVFTLPVTGWYRLNAWIAGLSGYGTLNQIWIAKNGTTGYSTGSFLDTGLTGAGTLKCSSVDHLTAGTTLRLMVSQNGGSSQSLSSASAGYAGMTIEYAAAA